MHSGRAPPICAPDDELKPPQVTFPHFHAAASSGYVQKEAGAPQDPRTAARPKNGTALRKWPLESWKPGSFTGVPEAEQLDLFVDGSYIFPASPHLRLASWAVTLARHDASVTPFILNAGLLPGRIASLSGARVKVWCDCLGVVRRCQGLQTRSWRVRPSTANSDLWQLVSEALLEVRGSFEVCKVDSHFRLQEEDDFLMEWLILSVRLPCEYMSRLDRQPFGAVAANWMTPLVRRSLFSLPLLRLGHVNVRRDTQFARKYGYPLLAGFEDWFRGTFFPVDAAADRQRWVAIFQLVVAYVQHFGRRPPFYDKTSQTWYEADDRRRGALLETDAGQLTSWFCRLLRAYVLATGGCYHSADARPDSTVLQVKMRVVNVYWPLQVANQVESSMTCQGEPQRAPELKPSGLHSPSMQPLARRQVKDSGEAWRQGLTAHHLAHVQT